MSLPIFIDGFGEATQRDCIIPVLQSALKKRHFAPPNPEYICK
jgi:hypothetical protein